MNIIEIGTKAKVGDKITGSIIKERKAKYWEMTGDNEFMNDKGQFICISKEMLSRTDYEFYEEGIRPKAGEIWKLENDKYFITQPRNEAFLYAVDVVNQRFTIDIQHGQNGWARIHPPVQDNDIERVEIEDVKIGSIFLDSVSLIFKTNQLNDKFRRAQALSMPVKAILEYNKEGEG